MASSFVVERLTGAWVLDHHSASQCDPLYDLAAQTWNAEWAHDVVGPLPLPPLAWPAEVVGTVRATGAARDRDPDGHAGRGRHDRRLGGGGERRRARPWPADGHVRLDDVLRRRQRPPGAQPRHLDDDRRRSRLAHQAAGTATSGSITAWLRDLVGGDYAALTAEAAEVEPGSDGIVALPYFAGERTPVPDPHARGVFAGLTLRHGRGHLYRAVLEATAYAARHNLEALELDAVERVAAVGGGAGSELWVQIVSDVVGRGAGDSRRDDRCLLRRRPSRR